MTFEEIAVPEMKFGSEISQLKNWQDLLLSLRHENSLLKIRLSELVDNSIMSDFLSRAENLNNELILNDNTIALLLTMADRLYSDVEKHFYIYDNETIIRQKNLGLDIAKFLKRFRILSNKLQADLKNVNYNLF